MAFLTDNPISRISHDRFGFRAYVEELHSIVMEAETLPVTIGIFGPWGSGKSSFMRMWQDQLAFAPEDRTLWFNPWKYDQKIEVWAALLQTLLAELAANETASQKVARLASAATWLTLKLGGGASLSAATSGAINVNDITAGTERLAATNADYYRDLNRFELDFAEAVEAYLGPQGRLFVFVDDLDRCTPDAGTTVLEALKLFAGEARCVFVLGMDYDLLIQTVTAKFGDNVAANGAAYLEKIVQLPFFLPAVSFAAIRKEMTPYVGDLAAHDPFWALVQNGFGNNPRRVKRFVNVLSLATTILGRDTSPAGSRLDLTRSMQLARMLVIRGEHRAFYQHLLHDQGAWQTLVDGPRQNLGHELKQFATDAALMRSLGAGPEGKPAASPAPSAGDVIRLLSTVRLSFPGRELPGSLPSQQATP